MEQGHMDSSRRASGNRVTEKHIIVVEAAEQSCHTWTGPLAAQESLPPVGKGRIMWRADGQGALEVSCLGGSWFKRASPNTVLLVIPVLVVDCVSPVPVVDS
jgi:hypothetical protein